MVIVGAFALVVLWFVAKTEWFVWHEFVPTWWAQRLSRPSWRHPDLPIPESVVLAQMKWEVARDQWDRYWQTPVGPLSGMFAWVHVAVVTFTTVIWWIPITLCAAWKTWGRKT